MNGSPLQRRRSDAERNRTTILSVARAAFVDPTASEVSVEEVSMAEVARRAGVGMATLYRNFPGRRELLEAVYTEEVDNLCADTARDGADPPGAALLAWLRNFAAFFSGKRRLAVELLEHTDATDPFFESSRDRVLNAGRPLLLAAQAAHEVRTDLTIEQAVDLVVAVTTIARDHQYIQPILDTALDGLRGPHCAAGCRELSAPVLDSSG